MSVKHPNQTSLTENEKASKNEKGSQILKNKKTGKNGGVGGCRYGVKSHSVDQSIKTSRL